MSSHRIDELLHKLQQLQSEVETEVEALLAEKQAAFLQKKGGHTPPGKSREKYAPLLVRCQGYKLGFSWSVSVQGKARLAANGRRPLQEAQRRHGC